MGGVYVAGAAMVRFGRFPDINLKNLARGSIDAVLADAGLERSEIEAVYFSNAMAGIVTGQECIRGQTVLTANGIGGRPLVNVENACASGSTAVNLAAAAIAAGQHDVVLVLGVEKLFHANREVSYRALAAATDLEESGATNAGSVFLEESGRKLRAFMETSGATLTHVAGIAAKNRANGALNPLAQYQVANTVEEILASPPAASPLTRLMCSPLGDGSAALVLCSERFARARGLDRIKIAASVLGSAGLPGSPPTQEVARAVSRAYERAGIGPQDVSLTELHDTTAASELMLYETLGLCPPGGTLAFLETGAARIGGASPVNTSGGLIARGHPVGATGIAQLCEIVDQLRGRAGARQVEGAHIGLAHNVGGTIHAQPAAICITILASDRSA